MIAAGRPADLVLVDLDDILGRRRARLGEPLRELLLRRPALQGRVLLTLPPAASRTATVRSHRRRPA